MVIVGKEKYWWQTKTGAGMSAPITGRLNIGQPILFSGIRFSIVHTPYGERI